MRVPPFFIVPQARRRIDNLRALLKWTHCQNTLGGVTRVRTNDMLRVLDDLFRFELWGMSACFVVTRQQIGIKIRRVILGFTNEQPPIGIGNIPDVGAPTSRCRCARQTFGRIPERLMQRGYARGALRRRRSAGAVFDMVKQSHYSGISVTIFGTTHSSNPKPGDYYLPRQKLDNPIPDNVFYERKPLAKAVQPDATLHQNPRTNCKICSDHFFAHT